MQYTVHKNTIIYATLHARKVTVEEQKQLETTQVTPLRVIKLPLFSGDTVQPKNNARARSGARSSCTVRTCKRQEEVKLRFICKNFQTQEVQKASHTMLVPKSKFAKFRRKFVLELL